VTCHPWSCEAAHWSLAISLAPEEPNVYSNE
jgi:hypothetical protein